jgi:GNAT superfamily N-acetyltransferase
LEHSRYLKRLDDKPVWSIVCFFIHSQYRRQGIASTLIKAAIKYVAEQGAPALESYPILEWGSKVTKNNAYTGTVEMFEKAGFQRVKVTRAKSGGQPRVVMRFNFTF